MLLTSLRQAVSRTIHHNKGFASIVNGMSSICIDISIEMYLFSNKTATKLITFYYSFIFKADIISSKWY